MDSLFELVVSELKAQRGVDFSGYREGTLERRITSRISHVCRGDFENYLQQLKGNPDECDRMIETITINVSSFFRNPMMWEVLARDVLPEIIERKIVDKSKEIRIWSAGCANGEEPYSIAILIDLALKGIESDFTRMIFATDLDKSALENAEIGRYKREQFKDTKLNIIDTYFTPNGSGYELNQNIRDMTQFSWGDVTSSQRAIPASSVYGSFDIVLCRNVLIYFDTEIQAKIFRQLNRAITPGGYLLLGDFEMLNQELDSTLHTVDNRNKIYRRPLEPQRACK